MSFGTYGRSYRNAEASNHINGALIKIDGGGLAGGITPTGVAPQPTT